MATRTWMLHGLWLGVVGFSLATGCVVKSDDDDDVGGGAGEAGDTSTGGSSTGGKGGSAGSGTGGKGGSAGSTTTGGSGGSGGSAGSGTGGSSGTMNTDPECDPGSGELVNTSYPNCTATPGNSCEECIERSCCEFSQVCYGFNPGNVCGWGGPDGDGEFSCYVDCVTTYYEENGVYDEDGVDECTAMCVTPMCGTLPGNATQDIVECVDANCQPDCYGVME